jgi:predicted transcriptional regulator
MTKKTRKYQLISSLIESWKPRAKLIKYNLKDLAKDSGKGITPQHLSALINGKVNNPRFGNVNDIEMALRSAEKMAVENGK